MRALSANYVPRVCTLMHLKFHAVRTGLRTRSCTRLSAIGGGGPGGAARQQASGQPPGMLNPMTY